MNKTTFSELEINLDINRVLDEMGFTNPTDIQNKAIPAIRSGVDVIGKSQTGTGKTIAFAIPAIEKIDIEQEKPTAQVLIICPTRELAQQGYAEIKKLIKYMPEIKVVDIYGGVSMERQISKLKKAHIVIGTPGRIKDHLKRRTLKLQNIKMVVLDEADEMLSMGFKEDIDTILKTAPDTRQTVLFSATMPPAIMNIIDTFLKNPLLIQIDKEQVTVNKIAQNYIDVPKGKKKEVLNLLLHYYGSKLTIIFCNTKRMVDDLTKFLRKNGFSAECLHGDIRQNERSRVMSNFKNAKTPILVATDVAARGIDVKDVEYVINYDIPQNSEYYIHRIGRTARGGKTGTSITMTNNRKQVTDLKMILKETNSKIKKLDIPTKNDINSKNSKDNMSVIISALKRENNLHDEMISDLKDLGYSENQIAKAALNLYFGETKENIVKIEDISINKETKRYNDGNKSNARRKKQKSYGNKSLKDDLIFYENNRRTSSSKNSNRNKKRTNGNYKNKRANQSY